MKTLKYLNIIILLTFFFIVWACKDNIFDNPVDTNVTLSSPSSLSVVFLADTAATISWEYKNPEKYLFVVELSEDNKTFTKLGEATSSNSLTANKAFLVGKKYYFRVNANGDMNKSGYTSAEAVLTGLDAPSQLTATFQNDTTAVLTWIDNSLFETGFVIELSANDNSHFEIVDTINATTTTTNVFDNFQKSMTYYFRLHAFTKHNTSAYSNIASNGIKPEVPILNLPANGAIDQSLTPTFSWDASAGATSYSLQVSINNFFSSYVINENIGNITGKQIDGLNYLTTYYWRVSAANTFGTSAYSSDRSFTTTGTAPQPPYLNSPTNGATDQTLTPTLSWNASVSATSYTLQVSTSSSFTSYVYNQSNLTSISQQLNGLLLTTQYYWRVIATNNFGASSASASWSFTTRNFVCGTDEISYSEKKYHTVQIGMQCWLKESLDVGTMIQGSANPSDNGTIEKYCYNNNMANCSTYGGLYQWNEAMAYSTSSGIKGICPDGWHIPTMTEFETLMKTVGYNGNKLKREDQGTGSGVGTNTSGFSALLAGYRHSYGGFYSLGNETIIWSSTEDGATNAYGMDLWDNNSDINMFNNSKEFGFSIRCLKD